jgi:aspartate/methionine/tyrosine aminotransferase
LRPLRPFALERFFAKHEFCVKYPLSASDCESFSLSELLAFADDDTLNLWNDLHFGYTETAGHPLLRKAVAELYRSVDHANVLIMAPEEAIFVAMHALLSPGDHVIGLAPAYQSLLDVPAMIGCDVSKWWLTPQDDAWTVDMELLATLCRPTTKALVINFPHNPTGFHPSRATFDEILDFARQKNLWVFSDEIYRFAELDSDVRLPAVCDVYERGITFGGLSKTFGLPGLRVGWIVSHQVEFLRDCVEWRDYTTICNSAPSEILAIAALRAKQHILDRQVGLLIQNYKRAQAFFSEFPDLFFWRPPTAGPVCIAEWRGPCSSSELFGRLLERNILMAPGELFGCGKNDFRVGLGRRSFPDTLAQMREAIQFDLK